MAGEEKITEISDLPLSLVMEILSRLPMKNLFNCKLVCKTWPHLISDPLFLELQVARPFTDIMVQIKSRIFVTHVEDRATDNNILEVEKTHFDIKVKFPGCNFDVVGSCNGLLCLEITKLTGFKSDPDYRSDPGYKSVCVCNPFLDEYVTIPIIPMEERDIMRLGFGNSALSKQYKVIQLFYYGDSHKYLRAEIYTISTGWWRSVGNAPGKVCCSAWIFA